PYPQPRDAQPPRANGPIYVAPPPQVGRAYPPEPYDDPPPPGGTYREPPPGSTYREAAPGGMYREPPPVYREAPPGGMYREAPAGYEPIEPRGRTVLPVPSPLDILRPPGAVGVPDRNVDRNPDPRLNNRGTTGTVYSALPLEDRPEVGPRKDL